MKKKEREMKRKESKKMKEKKEVFSFFSLSPSSSLPFLLSFSLFSLLSFPLSSPPSPLFSPFFPPPPFPFSSPPNRRESQRREDAMTKKSRTLFVVNYNPEYPDTEGRLGEYFSQFGEIEKV